MKIYLVRHGEARSEQEDPMRPLNEKGREDVKLVATVLRKLQVAPQVICHSGKIRAKETAELIALELGVLHNVRLVPGLRPNDAPEAALKLIEAEERDVMLVGHLPNLSQVASLLLANDPDKEVVHFPSAGVICVERVTDESESASSSGGADESRPRSSDKGGTEPYPDNFQGSQVTLYRLLWEVNPDSARLALEG